MRHFVSLLLIIFSFSTTVFSQATIQPWTYQSGVGTNWDTSPYKAYIYNQLRFRMMFPQGFDSLDVNSNKPVFLFLHGKGEAGLDNNIQLKHGGKFIKDKINNGDFPGFAIFPQNESGFWNVTHLDKIVALLEVLHERYHIDLSRVYVSGLSAGGYASWDILDRYPQYFAASIPMSASSVVYKGYVNSTVHIPKWLSQGGLDNAPAPYTSLQVLEAFKNGGGEIKYSFFPTNGHDTWNDMFRDPDYIPFLLQYSKLSIHTFFDKKEYCPGDAINTKIGISPGFSAYEWAKNTVVIPGATSNNYNVTALGDYTVRYKKGGVWSPWSSPVTIKYEDATVTPPISTVGLASVALQDLGGKKTVTLQGESGLTNFQWRKQGSSAIIGTNSTYVASSSGYYVLTAQKDGGCYALSSEPFLVTYGSNATAPSAPANLLTTTMSETSISLSWDQNPTPQYNEKAFEVYRSEGESNSFSLIKITAADITDLVDIGLKANTKYYYKVRAINDGGYSLNHVENNATTFVDSEAPSIPTNLTVVGSPESMLLSWNESTDNVGVKLYEIFQFGSLVATTTSTSFVVLGIQAGENYAYRIKAVDLAGNKSAFSEQVVQIAASSGLNYSYYEVEGMSVLPNFNTLTPVKTGHSIDFSLSPKERNDDFAFKFDGYITIPTTGTYTFETTSDDGSKLYIGGFDEANLLVNNDGLHGDVTVSKTINLTEGLYPITVTFFERNGGENLVVKWQGPGFGKQNIPPSAFEPSISVLAVPEAPSTVTGIALSHKAIQLSWANVASETGYEVFRASPDGEGFKIIAATGANVTTYIDQFNITPSTTYLYKIRAINNNGASPFSGGSNASTLTYKYYLKSGMNKIPNFAELTPNKTGVVNTFSMTEVGTAASDFAIYFDGYINAPVTGAYEFSLTSDDGSKLYIGDFNENNLIINHDGPHGTTTKKGLKSLTAGSHRIIVTYYQGGGDKALEVRWKGPNFSNQLIPASAFVKTFIEVTSLDLPSVPGIPTNPAAIAVSTSEISFSWDNSTGDVGGYKIYRAIGTTGDFRLVQTVSSAINSINSTNLFPHLMYRYKVKAYNAGGDSDFSNEVSGLTSNSIPVIPPISPVSIRFGTVFSRDIISTDADGDDLTYEIISIPSFVTFADSGSGKAWLSIHPQFSDLGKDTLIVRAFDDFGGADTLKLPIDVNLNNSPVIGVIPNQEILEGATKTETFTISDLDDDVILLTSNNLPSFVALTNNGDGTGKLDFAPTYADEGVYNITIIASDGKGASAESTFILSVGHVETDYTLYLNFNVDIDAGSPWNNVGKNIFNNKRLNNLVDVKQNVTTFDYVETKKFSGAFTSGVSTGNNSGVFRDEILEEYHYFWEGNKPQFKFSELDPLLVYDFTFFAASKFGNVNQRGTTNFTINGQTVSLFVDDNKQNTVKITGVRPDANNEIVIDLSHAANTSIGYLNALTIDTYIDNGLAPIAPVLKEVTGVSNGVLVTWEDKSYTESGFEIFKSSNGIDFIKIGETAKNKVSFTDVNTTGGLTYFYYVKSVNNNGSTTSNTLSILVPNRGPKITPIAKLYVNESSVYNQTVLVADPENDPLSFDNSILPSFVTISSVVNGVATLTIHPQIDDIGIYELVLIANDNHSHNDTLKVSLAVVDSKKQAVLINFQHRYGTNAPYPWNNAIRYFSRVYNELIYESGKKSTIGMTISNGWDAYAGNSGHRIGDDGGVFPDVVIADHIIYRNDSQTLLFNGLSPYKKYDFILFGSISYRGGQEATAPSNYVIGGVTKVMKVQNNSLDFVQFNGISPNANGEIEIGFKLNGADLGVINGIKIIESSEQDKPLRPENLKIKQVSKNSVTLTWRDDAYNEYFYELVRATSANGSYLPVATLPQNSTSFIDETVDPNKKYFYKIAAMNGEGSSGYSNVISVHTPLDQVFVNINGYASTNAPAPWNNLTTVPSLGDLHYNLLMDNGRNSGISISLDSKPFSGAGPHGVTTNNNTGMYPDAVMISDYYNDKGAENEMRIGNLQQGMKYRFILFGSVAIANKKSNGTIFSVGNKMAGLVTQFNYSNTAILDELVPDENGDILLKINSGPIPQCEWAMFNAITIQMYSEDENAVRKYNEAIDVANVASQIMVYPTVLSEGNTELTINLGNANSTSVNLVLSDIQGRVIYSEEQQLNGAQTITVNTGDIKPGSFILSIQPSHSTPISTHVIKQ